MYALSVRQPFASLILSGEKRYEARSWLLKEPGWLLLHASSNIGLTKAELAKAPFATAIKKANLAADPRQLPRSGLIGAFEVTGFVHTPHSRVSKRDLALCCDPAEDVLWKIGKRITFVRTYPCKGKLGLFVPDDDVLVPAMAELERR